ncbi:MAG: hypothetical protein ABSH06_00615 [Thermodesulfobacteriota bacterium]
MTGWAQINGRDELPIPVKVEYEEYDMKNKSFFLNLKILWLTFYIDAYGITTFSPPLVLLQRPCTDVKIIIKLRRKELCLNPWRQLLRKTGKSGF